jgi:hypothetical protein
MHQRGMPAQFVQAIKSSYVTKIWQVYPKQLSHPIYFSQEVYSIFVPSFLPSKAYESGEIG